MSSAPTDQFIVENHGRVTLWGLASFAETEREPAVTARAKEKRKVERNVKGTGKGKTA